VYVAKITSLRRWLPRTFPLVGSTERLDLSKDRQDIVGIDPGQLQEQLLTLMRLEVNVAIEVLEDLGMDGLESQQRCRHLLSIGMLSRGSPAIDDLLKAHWIDSFPTFARNLQEHLGPDP
jgi:hypothetical protein